MKFADIPRFTRQPTYKVDVGWKYLKDYLGTMGEGIQGGANMNPDFQRAHVWTKVQQMRYIEFIFKGGTSGKNIYWNCKGWQKSNGMKNWGPLELVDGKQRLTAALDFLDNKVAVFGGYFYKDFTDKMGAFDYTFSFHINDLDTRKEVLQWYLDLNSGGVVHTEKELDWVRFLIKCEE